MVLRHSSFDRDATRLGLALGIVLSLLAWGAVVFAIVFLV
jgi:hypothetical protein